MKIIRKKAINLITGVKNIEKNGESSNNKKIIIVNKPNNNNQINNQINKDIKGFPKWTTHKCLVRKVMDEPM